jgi:hypothetical protein
MRRYFFQSWRNSFCCKPAAYSKGKLYRRACMAWENLQMKVKFELAAFAIPGKDGKAEQ